MAKEPTSNLSESDRVSDGLFRATVREKLKPGGDLFLAFRDKHQLKILIEILTEVLESEEPTAG